MKVKKISLFWGVAKLCEFDSTENSFLKQVLSVKQVANRLIDNRLKDFYSKFADFISHEIEKDHI